jgi:hypothetical protein
MKTQDFSKSVRNLIVFAAVLAAAQATTTNAELVFGVSDQLGDLVSFDSASPQNLISARGISGLASGEEIRGIDFINGTLYGLGDGSHLYTINTSTAVATQVGTGAFSPSLNGIDFGFNAGTSQLYVSSDLGQNLTINALTGVATAGPNYTSGSSIDSLAYAFNGNLYGISSSSHNMYLLNPATGAVTLVGATGQSFVDRIGFDVSPNTGAAYFSGTVSGQTEFFDANLTTGALTLVGTIGTPGELTSGLDAIAVSPVPEPGTLGLLVAGGSYMLFGLIRRKK